jgi:enoyl-CoA hydratase
MSELAAYQFDPPVGVIRMDDGKANALSPEMLRDINAALDRAMIDQAVVVLTGRDGRFSAGFDLNVLGAGGPTAINLLRAGFETAERLLSFPTPVVMACTGHTIAMGLFLLLSGDYRVGGSGDYKLTANEVAIGLTMPQSAIEICRQRLTPAALTRVVNLAEVFAPDQAVAAGILDRVVESSKLEEVTRDTAVRLAALDMRAHAATKLRARAPALTALRAAIAADDAALRGQSQP